MSHWKYKLLKVIVKIVESGLKDYLLLVKVLLRKQEVSRLFLDIATKLYLFPKYNILLYNKALNTYFRESILLKAQKLIEEDYLSLI